MKNLLDIRSYVLMAMLLVATSLSAQAQTEVPVRYVSIAHGNYANDGRSWAQAKNNLQDAIEDLKTYMAENMLREGHVYVAAGTYTPTTATPGGDGTLYTSFIMYEGIHVYGGFNPDAPEARPEDRLLEDNTTVGSARGMRWKLKHKTILSGNHTHTTTDPLSWDPDRNEYIESFTGNSYHVVWFASAGLDENNRALGLGETAVLDGFTVRDGYAYIRSTPSADNGTHAFHNSYGAGIYMVANSEVRNCIITQNAASLRGGGVYMDGGGLLEQCYVTRNQAAGVGVTDGYGGGVAMDEGGMVRHCVIENNVARAGAGLSLIYWKAPETDEQRYAAAGVGTVVNNNTSTAEAGGVYLRNGGVLNHMTIARNKCVGVSVEYNNRKYARSGGLYIDGGAVVVNSVIWGNEVAANNNVQYATYRESSTTRKTTFSYVALSRSNYSDWGGTIKTANGVYNLSDENSNTKVVPTYPEFVKPTATAGVITDDVESDWTPRYFSYLRHKGMQIDNYPGGENIYHAGTTTDYMGDVFAPRCAIGALVAYSMHGAYAAGLANLEKNSGETVRTIFVDPELMNNVSMDANDPTGIGGSWDRPFHNINDAVHYITDELTGSEAPSATRPIQIVVKEGTLTTAGNAYLRHLRASTLNVPSYVRLYGGFPSSLKDKDISQRNPNEYPTRITANIVGSKYEDNGTHIIVLGHGTNYAIVDGFQLYFANTQPNKVLTSLGLHSGAGIAMVNSAFYPENPTNPTPAMVGNIVRNCVIANCTAAQGAAVYLGNASGRKMELKMENCIFHNNAVLSKDSAIVVAAGGNVDLQLNHCLVRGNVGYAVLAKSGAAVTINNSAVHANIGYEYTTKGTHVKVADLHADDANPDPRVCTFKTMGGGTITGSNNMMDIGVKDFNDIAKPVLRYHTTFVNENPNFVNATSNIGVNEDDDVTVYGGAPNWMPTNTNPMVNNAADDGMNGTDMTCNTTRNYGGAADIGALENTRLPEYGKVIYVRDYGNTTETGGDGSSWDKAINGNSLNARYKNNHGFEGVDAELYAEGTQLTGLQWAVDEAFYRSLEKDGNKIKYRTVNGVTHFKPRNQSTIDNSRTSIDTSAVVPDKRVEVWVAEGEYLRRDGFFMRNAVDVYGGFSKTGNPGKKERQPKTYETIIETNKSNEVTADGVTGEGQWGPQMYDFSNGELTYTEIESKWKIVDFSSDDQEGNAIHCIDKDNGTFWHSRWQDKEGGHGVKDGKLPQWIIIDLGEEYSIKSLKITNRDYRPTNYTIRYAGGNADPDTSQDHVVDESKFNRIAYSWNSYWDERDVTKAEVQTLNLFNSKQSSITCRYLYIKVNEGSADYVDIKEIQIYENQNASGEIKNVVTSKVVENEAVTKAVYDLNGYANAYKTKRVLTQPYPYFQGTGQIDGKTSGQNLEYDNKVFNSFSVETTWDGFIIQNGRTKITHQRDGGAGVALRENGRIANCVIRNNVMKVGTNARGAGIFQNGGVIENCVIEGNILVGEGGNIFGSGLYQRTGTVFNTSFDKNVLKGSGKMQGTAVYFENGRFYNNTITGNEGPYTVYSGRWFTNGRIDVYNTIICNNKITGDTDQEEEEKKNLEFNCKTDADKITLKNCLFDSANDHRTFGSDYTGVDVASFRYISGTVGSVDKLFVDPDKDFRLLKDAPAINAGIENLGLDITDTKAIELPSYDADYTNRVKDCIVDIGAYEYNGAGDIVPDTKTDGYAFYYVIPHGTGNASADSPQNAACWRKLQQVLDAAGRYTYDHRNDENRRIAVVKLAGDSKKKRTIGGKEVTGYEGFTYRPNRSSKITSPGEDENQRYYSLILPHGVEVWGGYPEDFEETKRDVLEYRTSFSGIFQHDDVEVRAYNVVVFTNDTYNADGEVLVEDGLKDIGNRAVLDGLFIENGKADGEEDETRSGAAAIVTDYAHVRNCIVQNNTAADMGGGLYLKPGALVSGSIIQYNVSNLYGGGVYVEEPEEKTVTPNYARIYTSDIIYNTASRAGGGLYFETNLRANSSLFWQNQSSEMANIAGETMPSDVFVEEPGINDYPISFCATETTREPGIGNIIVHTDMTKGVRFEDEAYNHDYTATDGTKVTVMHNEHEFYQLSKYSLIVRSGMAYTDYDALVAGQDGLLKTDMAGVDRTGYDNEFIDIGARAYEGLVLPEPNTDRLMTRIFVARSEDEVSMDAVNVMRNQTDDMYYAQEGSSFAYPMRYFGDALEYIRTMRKINTAGEDEEPNYKYRNEKFEIIVGGGTYYPRRNIEGEYVNGRGCTFLVPEGVTIIGGVNVQNDGQFYGNVSKEKEGPTTDFTYGGHTVTINHESLHNIIRNRKLHDINHNNIAEPWEMELQTILSGQVVNSATSHNVYHIVTCVADENLVGGLPDPTFDYRTKFGNTVAGRGTVPELRGQPVIIDGVNMEDGMAMNYLENAVNNENAYFRGGAICVEGNWTTGRNFKNYTDAPEKDHSPVGYRNIPLEVRNSTFMNNGGGRGGAIYTDSELKVFACNFAQNYARRGSDIITTKDKEGNVTQEKTVTYAGRGGAINASYETILVNTIFANNEADPEGNTEEWEGVGGAVLLSNYARLHVLNCDFVRNLAAGYPAIFSYEANKGVTAENMKDLQTIRKDNPHKVINSIFWGNESRNSKMDKVINFDGYRDGYDEGEACPEALWFCAYEEGKGNDPVYSKNKIDYRLQDYDGYILDEEEKYTGNPTYIPYLWTKKYKKLGYDEVSVEESDENNPDAVDGLNPVTNNIIINSDNNAIDGPNFISPSTVAGKAGFYISADWMIGRINNLVDNGWAYLQQDLSGEEPEFLYGDKVNKTDIKGSGIYHSASYDYGRLSDARTAIPIGDDLYMSYNDDDKKPILRVSPDPNPTHHQTFIDLGVYEYQHVKLEPFNYDEVDVLWVTEREKTGGASDGKTWATATSDLQRAIETLLASRNDHDKEIRMLEGNYQPVYTINGNLAFTVTTDIQTGITVPDDNKHGVRSLTIRGGYSKDLEGQENVETYPVHLYASERTGGDLNFDHVLVIGDMKQRISQKSGNGVGAPEMKNYVVPVTIKGLNFSNIKARPNDGGVAVSYEQQDVSSPTYFHENNIGDNPEGKELYVLTMTQCTFFNNGSLDEDYTPAVTIGKSMGKSLIYNSLFHSNKGTPLAANNTKVVNCTFALNDEPVILLGKESELHNSILWRNSLMDGGDDYIGPEPSVRMTNNAISTLDAGYEDGFLNVPLSLNNSDALQGPNFFNPREVPYGTTAFENTMGQHTRDFHVNPSSKILSKGSVDKYVELVKNKKGEYPYAGADNIGRVKADKDLADVIRFYGSGLERGAYECVAIMNRVLYVNPNNAIPGNGVSWGTPYGKGQIQTAIDAAAVYHDVNDKAKAYVFVKGIANGDASGESLTMREGVSLYGSIDHNCTAEVEKQADGTYLDSKINSYIASALPANRKGMAVGTHTIVGGVKADDNVEFGICDGLEIGNKDDGTPVEERTEPVVALGNNSSVALVNSIVSNNRVKDGVNLIENNAGLLYNILVRDNGKADVALGENGYALNCTFAGDAGSWTMLDGAADGHSINNIMYREGDKQMPFAPYFRRSDVAYHADEVPNKDNKNLWYQLHEKAPYIGVGNNGDASNNGKSLLPAALQPYVDFSADRDLLGNPRLLGRTIDRGCYETWSTGYYDNGDMTAENLFANRNAASYSGQHYPHEGSVVYLQKDGKLVCELEDVANRTPYFTETSPLRPGYLLAMDGGSLYGQGNEIRLQYVAAERKMAGQYAMVALPFDTKNDGRYITRTSYDEANSMKEEPTDYAKFRYDGEARSLWNYEFSADNSECWKEIAADGVIAANDGYLMDRGAQEEETLRFTAFDRTAFPYQEGAGDKTVTLTQYDQSEAGSKDFRFTSEYNMGWNLKGMPYLISGYDTGEIGEDGKEAMFVPHVIYTMNDEGNYNTAYSWKWNGNETAVSPCNAFFTQTAVIGDGKTENLRFAKLYYTEEPGAREEMPARMPSVVISGAGYGSDEVMVCPAGYDGMADGDGSRDADGEQNFGEGSLDYRFGADGVKFAALNDTLPQISVCGTDGVGMSLLSHAPMGVEIPLTVEVKGSASYTFSLSDRGAYSAYSDVYVKDNETGTVTNLVSGDYTTEISPMDSPSRFSLFLGENPEWNTNRKGNALYNINGMRMKTVHGSGVYIEVGDKTRKVVRTR